LKRRSRNTDHSFEAINVTPMIDVVMCLIIFFLLVGKLATDRSAALRLPQSKEGEAEKASDTLVVSVTRTPPPGATDTSTVPTGWPAAVPFVISEDRTLADAGSLERLVRTRLLERPLCVVQVRAERDLSYGSVQPVLSALARGGAKTVRLALERTQ
jgi:biopolymer transport protein ExbD